MRLSEAVGRRLGLSAAEARAAGQVAVLRDIGLVSVPDTVLNKPGPLTSTEMALLQRHPIVGAQMVRLIPDFAALETFVRGAHERWDGNGYPDGRAGDDLPLIDRVAFTCSAYVAMLADRPYRRALTQAEARAELFAGAGTQFCERTVRALLDTLDRPAPSGA